MMDISDGLVTDLARLALASGVGIAIESARVPIHPSVGRVAGHVVANPVDWALTGGEDVPKGGDLASGVIPVTYVPARNTLFLAHALAWAERLSAARLFIGANAVDYSGYPDCRPEYLRAFEAMANLATKAAVEGRVRYRVEAPLVSLSKAAIIARGLALGVDYGLTSSCYDPSPGGQPCDECDSCRLRAKGFAEAGLPDPLVPGTPRR